MKKLPIFIFIAVSFFIVFGGFIFAAERSLEVPLPGIGGEPGVTGTPLLPDYIKYIFNFVVGIGGLVVFGVLIYGGLRFLTSAGNPSKMSDAKDQIFSALLGLVVLLGSWLILNTINPELIKINPVVQESGLFAGNLPGVYLCKTEFSIASSPDCQLFIESRQDLGSLNDKVGYIRFAGDTSTTYGAVLHENKYQEGTCQIFTTDGPTSLPSGSPSSITIFKQGTAAGGIGAVAFDDKEYDLARGYYNFGVGEYSNLDPLKYSDCAGGGECRTLENTMSSLKVTNDYMAVLFGDDNYSGACAVFFSDISALGPTPVGNDQVSSIKILPASR